MSVITTIEDLRVLAEKRVPRMFYDYADSGSWTESTYRANEDDFRIRQSSAHDRPHDYRLPGDTLGCERCGEGHAVVLLARARPSGAVAPQ